MSTPRRLRMSTLLETRDGIPSNKDSRLTNCILEQDGKELNVLKRPGFTTNTTFTAGVGNGATVIQTPDGGSQLVSFIDATMYVTQMMPAGTFTSIGSTPGTGVRVPAGLLYFNSKFWVLNYRQSGAGIGEVYSSPDAITWTLATASAAYNWSTALQEVPCVAFQGKMWTVSGNNAGADTRRVYNSTDGVTWTLIATAPAFTARQNTRLLVYNNKIWLIGGIGSGNVMYNDVWSTSDGITWTQATASAAWAARSDFACFVLAGKMWVCGGANYNTAVYYNDCYYSTDGITWSLGTGAPGWTARSGMGYAVLNNFAYILGGRNAASGGTPNIDMWRTPDGITWTQVTADDGLGATIPSALGANNFISNGIALYLIGFWTANAVNTTNTNTYTASIASTSIKVST